MAEKASTAGPLAAQAHFVTPEGLLTTYSRQWLNDLYNLVIAPNSAVNEIPEIKDALEVLAAAVAVIEGQIEILTGLVAANTQAIQDNESAIAVNTARIDDVTAIANENADAIALIQTELAAHIAATVAHGSTGDIVGNLDLAQPAPGDKGVVSEADPNADVAGAVAGADTVNATTIQELVDQFNSLQGVLRAAGILDT